jgi:hypothetical protein
LQQLNAPLLPLGMAAQFRAHRLKSACSAPLKNLKFTVNSQFWVNSKALMGPVSVKLLGQLANFGSTL